MYRVVSNCQEWSMPVTALRRGFERARSLEPDAQIQACIHQLTHPELLAREVLQAWEIVQSGCPEPDDDGKPLDSPPATDRHSTLVEEFFYATRELMVLGDRCSFTCLSSNVQPLPTAPEEEAALSVGLDYVGLTCDNSATLVLGAVQAPGDATAYPLLLRLLACLTEIAPAAQRERMNRDYFLGVASPDSRFDLNLVLWDRAETPQTNPISELTRDLAEKVKEALVASPSFPPILRDVVCLRMNPDRFDGRMRFDWRV